MFLFATRCLDMMIICAILFSNPNMRNKVMGRTRIGFTDQKSLHKVQVRTVTFTFNLATFFFFATHCLVMIINCAKLFLNPIMYG